MNLVFELNQSPFIALTVFIKNSALLFCLSNFSADFKDNLSCNEKLLNQKLCKTLLIMNVVEFSFLQAITRDLGLNAF